MSTLQIHMFGKFEIIINGEKVNCFHSQKAQELFCFLILFCNRPHNREQLAEMFWEEHSTAESRRYLRKILWQLRSALTLHLDQNFSYLIEVDRDWLRFIDHKNVWVDVLEFKQLMYQMSQIQETQFDLGSFKLAQKIERLYCGDLLEGCYQDWCTFERERLKECYISIVDKLIAFCESHSLFDIGINYGFKLLSKERAHERTYERMIRLYLNSGDRISALRMCEVCKEALKKEYGIAPSQEILDLYQVTKIGIDDHESNSICDHLQITEH